MKREMRINCFTNKVNMTNRILHTIRILCFRSFFVVVRSWCVASIADSAKILAAEPLSTIIFNFLNLQKKYISSSVIVGPFYLFLPSPIFTLSHWNFDNTPLQSSFQNFIIRCNIFKINSKNAILKIKSHFENTLLK